MWTVFHLFARLHSHLCQVEPQDCLDWQGFSSIKLSSDFQKQRLLEFICSIKSLNKAPVPDRSAPTRLIYLVYWIRINFNTWFVTTQIIFDFMMPPKSKQYSMVIMIYLLKLTEWLRLNTKKSPPNSIKKQKRQIIRTTNHTAGKLIIFNPNGPELQNPLKSK